MGESWFTAMEAVIDALRARGLWSPAANTTAPRSAPVRTRITYPSPAAAITALETRIGGRRAGTWIYKSCDGSEVLRMIRLEKPDGSKAYRPLHMVDDKWCIGDPPGPLPLYGLSELTNSNRIYVVEGEKCVDAARTLGLTATTSAHGAKAPHRTDWWPLAGKEVVILPDCDAAGRAYADAVAQILRHLKPPASIKIVEIPGLPDGGDLADYIELRDSTESEDLARCIEHLADAAPRVEEPANSIRAPIERGDARIEYAPPVPASALGRAIDLDWVWSGYIARGLVTLLVGLWKAGKTTLLAHLIRAIEDGSELALPVTPGRVLVVAEEVQALWARRRDELGIGDHAEFDIQPFLGRPSPLQWERYLLHLGRLVRERSYALVVFDTLASMSPVPDENNAAEMLAALTPLRAITKAGAAVLLIHHPRKGDAGEGQASRGSGALTGFVDVIVELRRYDPKQRDDTRRVLTAYSRLQETPHELVMELTSDGYRRCGSRADAHRGDRLDIIADILAGAACSLTTNEVRGAWPQGDVPTPGRRTIEKDLQAGAEAERWSSSGSGHKGDPLRYQTPQDSIRTHTLSIGARNEFCTEATTGTGVSPA